jgi:hypothetical protein
MAARVELAWKPRGNQMALVLRLIPDSIQRRLTVYVLDPARPICRRPHGSEAASATGEAASLAAMRQRDLVNGLVAAHGTAHRPAALCQLGRHGPPLLTAAMDRRGSPPTPECCASVLGILADPPDYGRWWAPTVQIIERIWREFRAFPFKIYLLSHGRQSPPFGWCDDATVLGQPPLPVHVVDDEVVRPACWQDRTIVDYSSWDAFLHSLGTEAVLNDGDSLPAITLAGSAIDQVALDGVARAAGWQLTREQDQSTFSHPGPGILLAFPAGETSVPEEELTTSRPVRVKFRPRPSERT